HDHIGPPAQCQWSFDVQQLLHYATRSTANARAHRHSSPGRGDADHKVPPCRGAIDAGCSEYPVRESERRCLGNYLSRRRDRHFPRFFAGSPNLVVGNIDASPDLEILAPGLAGGPIYAWKANGAVAAGWPVGLIDGGVGLLALGNLVGAGDRLEVVAGRADSP